MLERPRPTSQGELLSELRLSEARLVAELTGVSQMIRTNGGIPRLPELLRDRSIKTSSEPPTSMEAPAHGPRHDMDSDAMTTREEFDDRVDYDTTYDPRTVNLARRALRLIRDIR